MSNQITYPSWITTPIPSGQQIRLGELIQPRLGVKETLNLTTGDYIHTCGNNTFTRMQGLRPRYVYKCTECEVLVEGFYE